MRLVRPVMHSSKRRNEKSGVAAITTVNNEFTRAVLYFDKFPAVL